MKNVLLALALLVVLTPAALAEDAETPAVETPAAETVAAQPETAEPVVTDEVLDRNGLPIAAIELLTEKAGYECPSYTIYCWRDSQCDGYCGAPGAGACEFGCCACLF